MRRGYVTFESREAYIRRIMRRDGITRKRALAASTHLYPEDALRLPPYIAKELYTESGGHSPDTAAQQLHDQGLLPSPYVGDLWQAVRDDASTLAGMIRREEDRLMADAIRDAKAAVAGRDARIAEIEALSDAGRLSVTATPPERADAMLTEARIEEQKQHVWREYHNPDNTVRRGYLRAPNGKQTSLTADQWLRAHTPAFLEDYGDWQAAALWRLADRAWNDPTAKETFKFRPSERLNAALEQLLGHAVEEFVISSDTARHIKAHHGDESHEKKRGQSAMTPEDVAVIPYIINSFDDAYRAPKNDKPNGEKSVEIMKRINGTSIVATIEAGPNRQIVVTTWKLVPTASMKSRRSDPPRPNVRNDIDTNTPNNVHNQIEKIKRNLRPIAQTLDANGEPTAAFIDAQDPAPRLSVSPLYTGARVPYRAAGTQFIGTGEGRQIFGWGLYATDRFGIAKSYADRYIESITRSDGTSAPSVMVQTWFADRPEGDESRLLSWYDPVPREQLRRIADRSEELLGKYRYKGKLILTDQNQLLLREGTRPDGKPITFPVTAENPTGQQLYGDLAKNIGSTPKGTSELLYASGIDGIKYPAASIKNPANRDGREGWNYVAFSDRNTRVDAVMTYNPETERYETVPDTTPRLSIAANPAAPVTLADDAAYAQALADGDRATLERIVWQAAQANGYTLKAYHGTNNFGFTVFDPSKDEGGLGLMYFASDRQTAASLLATESGGEYFDGYQTRRSGIYDVAISMDNPLIVDAQQNEFNEIPIPEEIRDEFAPYADLYEPSVEAFGKYAMDSGYDGAIIRNVYDPMGPGTDVGHTDVYVVFSPDQVKSLDPVTYDGQGRVILPSQRFNAAEPDIRYSISGVTAAMPIHTVLTSKTVREQMLDAKETLSQLIKSHRVIVTQEGDVLRFSGQSKKLYSKAAEEKSDDRGAHWAAVSSIDRLCEIATFIYDEPPRNGSPDIIAYRKYAAGLVFNGTGYIAKITVKSYPTETPSTIYSVESISLEKVGARGIHASIASPERKLDPDAVDKVSTLIDAVNSKIAGCRVVFKTRHSPSEVSLRPKSVGAFKPSE